MKKLSLIFVAVLVIFSLAGCGQQKETTADNTDAAPIETVQNEESASDTVESPAGQAEYHTGETWVVDGQWELTVTDITETSERNEFSDKNPATVYIVSYTYKNLGYVDANGFMNGLFLSIDSSVVDSQGVMGYSYPVTVTDYPQETPVGATCNAQACIGVDNAGLPIKLNIQQYDGNSTSQTATFIVD